MIFLLDIGTVATVMTVGGKKFRVISTLDVYWLIFQVFMIP